MSPLLSNIVLDELDHELERRGHRFVRYADDCNIYVRSERAGQRVMTSIRRFIERRLRPKVNADKSAVARPEDRHFVGFRLRWDPEEEAVEVLLSRRSFDRIAKKIRELTPRNWGQSIDDCVAGLNAYLLGWIGFFRVCTAAERRTLHDIEAHIRRRLRAILLTQWGSRTRRLIIIIIRHLVRLGAKRLSARRTVCAERRSWWKLSHMPVVGRVLNRAYFARRGLVSVLEQWTKLNAEPVTASAQLTLDLG